ncbi:LPXTG cell wall anchor domain-containing protein [Streptomyces sp. PG2]
MVRPVRERLAGHGPGVVDRDRHLGGRENLRRRCHPRTARPRAPASEATGGSEGEPATGTRALDGIEGSADTRLADTGSIDTTPYVVGGTLLLGLGAGFVAYSVRRERATAY